MKLHVIRVISMPASVSAKKRPKTPAKPQTRQAVKPKPAANKAAGSVKAQPKKAAAKAPAKPAPKPQAKSQPKPQSKPRPAANLQAQEDRTPRLVIQDTGVIAYVSPALATLLKIQPSQLQGQQAYSVLKFVDPADAQHDRPGLGGMDGDPWTASIIPGEHAVIASFKDTEKTLSMHFDWIKLPDGRRYLVATGLAARKGKEKGKEDADLKGLVQALVQKKTEIRAAAASQEVASFITLQSWS